MDAKVMYALGLSEDETMEQALAILEANATKTVDNYSVKLTESDVIMLNEDVADKSMQVKDIMDDMREYVKAARARMKPIKEDINNDLVCLKAGVKLSTGNVYRLKDFNLGMVHYISGELEWISSRPMNDNDRQLTLDDAIENQNK